jgi:hypothetical protein
MNIRAFASTILLATGLTTLMAEETNSVPPPFRVHIKSLGVQEKPYPLSEVVTNLSYKTVVEVVQRSNNWVRIKEGWVHSSGISRLVESTNASTATLEEFEAAVGIVIKQLTNGVNNTATMKKQEVVPTGCMNAETSAHEP